MRSILKRVALVLCLLIFAACTSWWQATQQPLRELEGKRVRLTTRDSTKVTGALFLVDSLGMVDLYVAGPNPRSVLFDTSQIVRVEKHRISNWMGPPLVAAGLLVLIALGNYVERSL